MDLPPLQAELCIFRLTLGPQKCIEKSFRKVVVLKWLFLQTLLGFGLRKPKNLTTVAVRFSCHADIPIEMKLGERLPSLSLRDPTHRTEKGGFCVLTAQKPLPFAFSQDGWLRSVDAVCEAMELNLGGDQFTWCPENANKSFLETGVFVP